MIRGSSSFLFLNDFKTECKPVNMKRFSWLLSKLLFNAWSIIHFSCKNGAFFLEDFSYS